MNIQIFGTKKSSDTRKAERFFKERRKGAQQGRVQFSHAGCRWCGRDDRSGLQG